MGITRGTQDHKAIKRTASAMKKAIARNPNPAKRKPAKKSIRRRAY